MEKRKYVAEGDVIVVTTINTYRVVSDNIITGSDEANECVKCTANPTPEGRGACLKCAANPIGMEWLCSRFECRSNERVDGQAVHLELIGTDICIDKNLM